MKYSVIKPGDNIKKYIRFFWILEGGASEKNPYVHRAMADGSAELVFHYRGVFEELITPTEKLPSFVAGLDGQSQKMRRFCTHQDFGIFGVYLYPFAISKFFGLPAAEVSNQSIDLINLLGKNEKGLIEKMLLAKNNLQRVEIITQFLENKINLPHKLNSGVFETISHIIHSKEIVDINKLAENNFLSRRQFERSFKEYAGFSPKLFARIIRFQNALKDYGKAKKSLTHIGLEAGYADQSHFIKEFKAFSGFTPKEYFFYKGEGTEWREAD